MDEITSTPEEKPKADAPSRVTKFGAIPILPLIGITILFLAIILASFIADSQTPAAKTSDEPLIAEEEFHEENTTAVPVEVSPEITMSPNTDIIRPTIRAKVPPANGECWAYGSIPKEELSTVYTTKRGDTYESISQRFYGAPGYAVALKSINSKTKTISLNQPLNPGIAVRVPPDVLMTSSENLDATAGKITEVANSYIDVDTGGPSQAISSRYYVQNSIKNPSSISSYNVRLNECVVVVANSSHTLRLILNQDEIASQE